MAKSFVPQLYVGLSFMALGKHFRFHLVRIENEHPAFPSSASDNSAFLFNEAPSIIEVSLHALFHNLVDRDQILRYCWNMQDVLNVGLVAFFPKWDITDMLNGVNCVMSSPVST